MANVSERVLDNLKRIGVQTAYGDTVALGTTSIVPVAVSGFGFGVGEGEGRGPSGEADADRPGGSGSGGGGGGLSIPIGAYVNDEFGTRFQPNIIALLGVSLPLVAVVGWALPKLVKALKR